MRQCEEASGHRLTYTVNLDGPAFIQVGGGHILGDCLAVICVDTLQQVWAGSLNGGGQTT